MVFIKKRERTEVAEELIHFLKSDCYKPRLKQEITRYVNEYESPIQEVIQGTENFIRIARAGKNSLLEEAAANRVWNPKQSIVTEWEEELRELVSKIDSSVRYAKPNCDLQLELNLLDKVLKVPTP